MSFVFLMDSIDKLVTQVVSEEELKAHEVRYYAQFDSKKVTKEEIFNYGRCLVRSKYAADVHRGLLLLHTLYRNVRADDPMLGEYTYLMALGHAKIREFKKAMSYLRLFLILSPDDEEALRLFRVLKNTLLRGMILNAAIAAGGIFILGALAILGLWHLRKN